jgi:hypothetical protein
MGGGGGEGGGGGGVGPWEISGENETALPPLTAAPLSFFLQCLLSGWQRRRLPLILLFLI